MIVRVVLYEATSRQDVRTWLDEHAAELDRVPGLDRVEFIGDGDPARAGAVMYFESPEELRQYKASERYRWLRESIEDSWGEGDGPIRDAVYRVLEPAAPGAREGRA